MIMPYIFRPAYPLRIWNGSDLEDVARFWIALLEVHFAERKKQFYYQVMWRFLWILPDQKHSLITELSPKLAKEEFASVRTNSPSAATFTSCWEKNNHELIPNLGFNYLLNTSAEKHVVELRIRVSDRRKNRTLMDETEATLVIRGEIREGSFSVKGIWKTNFLDGKEEEFSHFRKWECEDQFFREFEVGREDGWPDSPELKKLSLSVFKHAINAQKIENQLHYNLPLLHETNRGKKIISRFAFLSFMTMNLMAGLFFAIVGFDTLDKKFNLQRFTEIIGVAVTFLVVIFIIFLSTPHILSFFFLICSSLIEIKNTYKVMNARGNYLSHCQITQTDDYVANQPGIEQVSIRWYVDQFKDFGFEFASHAMLKFKEEVNYITLMFSPDRNSLAVILSASADKHTDGKTSFSPWPNEVGIMLCSRYVNEDAGTITGLGFGFSNKLRRSQLNRSVKYILEPCSIEALLSAHQTHNEVYQAKFKDQILPFSSGDEAFNWYKVSSEKSWGYFTEYPFTLADTICHFLQYQRKSYQLENDA